MQHLVPWFNLKRVPGIGNLLFKRLIDRFATPAQVFAAAREDLLAVEGISPKTAAAIAGQRRLSPQIETELEDAAASGCRVLTYNDAAYPRLLLQIPDPPPCLYVRGSLDLNSAALAIVGSRNASSYGKAVARRLSADLAACGATVVSGMALGIDTCAHQGALQAGGPTVAVMGTGLNHIYPARNRRLHDAIAERGAVVSELPVNAGPDARHFPARNRIISGLTLGTLVVEATLKSGSLITARLAAEQNREVYAVPGSIDSFKSTGTHALIKQGAKLVENVQDILEELPAGNLQPAAADASSRQIAAPPPGELTALDSKILAELDRYPVHIDELVRKLDLEPGKLAAALLQLELKGVVHQDRGSLFSRKTR